VQSLGIKVATRAPVSFAELDVVAVLLDEERVVSPHQDYNSRSCDHVFAADPAEVFARFRECHSIEEGGYRSPF
jgi:hypothetical protein